MRAPKKKNNVNAALDRLVRDDAVNREDEIIISVKNRINKIEKKLKENHDVKEKTNNNNIIKVGSKIQLVHSPKTKYCWSCAVSICHVKIWTF